MWITTNRPEGELASIWLTEFGRSVEGVRLGHDATFKARVVVV
jgi:hypothetical protein